MKRLLEFLLPIILLLGGCTPKPDVMGRPVTVFTLSGIDDRSVLQELTVYSEEEPLWEAALEAAVTGAGDRSAFPPGVMVTEAVLEDGLAAVTLSEEAAVLSGLSLTLARACIVLTLTSLDGIDGVILLIEGQISEPVVLRASDFVLGSLVLTDTERTVTLYFSDETGENIVTETRTLVVRETDTVGWYLQYMFDELIAGPRTAGLRHVIPEGTRLLSVIPEGGDCYAVNLSGEFVINAPGDESSARMVLSCLLRSAVAQPGVTSLRLLIDGQARDEYYGIDISEPLSLQGNTWMIR